MISHPLVSIVIPTRNGGKTIEKTLQSIKQQIYPQSLIETIVVDNHSTDNTAAIAKKYTHQVYTYGPERAMQRNYGMIQKAHGTYVFYLDHDMILSPNLIKECVFIFKKNSGIAALYVPEIMIGAGFWSTVRTFERSFYNGTVIDCVRCIRSDVVKKIGGFDETIVGTEDWDFDKRVRMAGITAITKNPLHHNDAGFTLKSYLKKKRYYAQNFGRYKEKWGRDDPDIRKQFSLSYRLFGVFTEDGKWKKLIKRPDLTLLMFCLRILVGVQIAISEFNYADHRSG